MSEAPTSWAFSTIAPIDCWGPVWSIMVEDVNGIGVGIKHTEGAPGNYVRIPWSVIEEAIRRRENSHVKENSSTK